MAGSDEIVCVQVAELVTDYLDGALEPEGHSRLEQHLVICEGCEAYVDQMRRTLEALRGVAGDRLPAGRRGALLEAFRSHTGRSPSP